MSYEKRYHAQITGETRLSVYLNTVWGALEVVLTFRACIWRLSIVRHTYFLRVKFGRKLFVLKSFISCFNSEDAMRLSPDRPIGKLLKKPSDNGFSKLN
jgi:hypothetical protein